MTDQSNMQCKIEGHQNIKFLYLNMSSDNKQDLFSCPVCIQQQFMDTQQNPKKYQKTLIIEQLKNDEIKNENLIGWPPIQDDDHREIYQNHVKNLKEFGQENDYSDREFNTVQEIIKKFDIQQFREKFLEFQQNKIDIDQLFDYKQQQNGQVYNNNKLYDSLKTQQEKVEELKEDLEKEFAKINDSISSFRKYQPSLKKIPQIQPQQQQQQQQPTEKQQQQLNFYKSNYNSDRNQGNFEIDNDQRTIKFKSHYGTYIYSENLQQKKEHHLRFTMDTKNNVDDIYLGFSITSGNEKNSKDLATDHYVRVFNFNNNSCASGGEFQVRGKQFYEFFKDNKTIVNVVFNIEKQMMEIYDDDRISYQKLTFDKDRKYDEWILGIYCSKGIFWNSEVYIQFID